MVMGPRALVAGLIFMCFLVGPLHALVFCMLANEIPTKSFDAAPSTSVCLDSGDQFLLSPSSSAQKKIHFAGMEKEMGTIRVATPANEELGYSAGAGLLLAFHPSSSPVYQLNSAYRI